MTAAKTTLPVLGVPVESRALNGIDSLLSIVQMPAGVPVGTLAIGKRAPDDADTFNQLAWLWATAPDAEFRNGERAKECAVRACELTDWQAPGPLDTLAAAIEAKDASAVAAHYAPGATLNLLDRDHPPADPAHAQEADRQFVQLGPAERVAHPLELRRLVGAVPEERPRP